RAPLPWDAIAEADEARPFDARVSRIDRAAGDRRALLRRGATGGRDLPRHRARRALARPGRPQRAPWPPHDGPHAAARDGGLAPDATPARRLLPDLSADGAGRSDLGPALAGRLPGRAAGPAARLGRASGPGLHRARRRVSLGA